MVKSFDIGGIPVGGDAPVFIVAELSANHAGRRDVALRTIEAAKKVGADAIKLQTYTPDTLTLDSTVSALSFEATPSTYRSRRASTRCA